MPVLSYEVAQIVRESFADTAGPPGTSAPTSRGFAPRSIFAPPRRGRRPRRPAVRPAPRYIRLCRGGACPSRGFRTAPNISHHPVGDGVPYVPQIRTASDIPYHPVGDGVFDVPFLQPSSMSAGGRGRPPLRRNDRSRTRRGRRPRRPAVRPAPRYARLRRDDSRIAPTTRSALPAQALPGSMTDNGRGKPLPYDANGRSCVKRYPAALPTPGAEDGRPCDESLRLAPVRAALPAP